MEPHCPRCGNRPTASAAFRSLLKMQNLGPHHRIGMCILTRLQVIGMPIQVSEALVRG
jgi:hypothetical protein